MPPIYALCNQKGGVGKTTTAINLAAAVAARKRRVLLVDIDPQGNATSGLGIDKSTLQGTTYDVLIGEKKISDVILQTETKGLMLCPANSDLAGAEIELVDEMGREAVLKRALEEYAEKFDYVFLDCPPSLGLLTLNSLVAASKMLIPLQCEYYALEGLGQLLKTYELVKTRLNSRLEIAGIVLTMADFRTRLTSEVIEEVRKHFQDKVYAAIIPRSVKLSEAPSFGKPAVFYDSSNRGAQAYQELAQEFLKREENQALKEGQTIPAAVTTSNAEQGVQS